MTNTITKEQFNKGEGSMPYEKFAKMCDTHGVDQTVWVAKYFGVSLKKVQRYVSLYMGWNSEK